MKPTTTFEKTIQDYLEKRANEDILFAETLKKENKNIKDCCTYIMNQVQASGCNGFADEEIFGMAVHYYDEDVIEIGKPMKGKVIVNHSVEITEEDKAEAKKQAMDELIEEAKKEAKTKLSENIELNDNDIADAKKIAFEKAVTEQKEKMIKKKEIKKPSAEKEVVPSLFD